MTSSHDPQPQSRRALRAQERAGNAAAQPAELTATDPPAPRIEPIPLIEPAVRETARATAPGSTSVNDVHDQTAAAEDEPSPAQTAPPSDAAGGAEPRVAEHSLTRRELRELRGSAGSDASHETNKPMREAVIAPVAASPAGVSLVDATPEALQEAPAEAATEGPIAAPGATSSSPFTLLRRSKRSTPEPSAHEGAADIEALEPPALVLPEQPMSVAAPLGAVSSATQEALESDETPAPAPSPAAAAAPTAFDALFTPKGPSSANGMPATSGWSAPPGHWSTQAGVDDDHQPNQNLINRTVGTGSSATNALVLPSIPLGSDIRGALSDTGQITLTGSIDLSHVLSSTGGSDRLESTDMDALLASHDAETISTDSAPVRAIRAVSTHSTGHGVTYTQKPKGNRALTGLIIAASSMAVVVAGLLVAALAFNLF
jgi:hypothetical protein